MSDRTPSSIGWSSARDPHDALALRSSRCEAVDGCADIVERVLGGDVRSHRAGARAGQSFSRVSTNK